jgi:hypothetical protein
MDTSLVSVQSQTKNANLLAEYLDTDELEAIAICFDNIRSIRRDVNLPGNDDQMLGDQFDQELTVMMADVTAEL